MTNDELVRANELADGLIAKFERIKSLWAEIPSAENLEEIGKAARARYVQARTLNEELTP